jgi:hypothetical protein
MKPISRLDRFLRFRATAGGPPAKGVGRQGFAQHSESEKRCALPLHNFAAQPFSSSDFENLRFEEGVLGYVPFILLRKIHMDRLYRIG